MLERQEDSRDKWNYLKPDRKYNIAQSLHLDHLDQKVSIFQEFCSSKVASYKIQAKCLIGSFQKAEKINQGREDNARFLDRNGQLRYLQIKWRWTLNFPTGLMTEEQAKEQHQSFIATKTEIDSMNKQAQAHKAE